MCRQLRAVMAETGVPAHVEVGVTGTPASLVLAPPPPRAAGVCTETLVVLPGCGGCFGGGVCGAANGDLLACIASPLRFFPDGQPPAQPSPLRDRQLSPAAPAGVCLLVRASAVSPAALHSFVVPFLRSFAQSVVHSSFTPHDLCIHSFFTHHEDFSPHDSHE